MPLRFVQHFLAADRAAVALDLRRGAASARMSLGMLHARSHSFDLDPSRDVRAAETDVLLAAVAMHVRCPAFHSITAVIACE